MRTSIIVLAMLTHFCAFAQVVDWHITGNGSTSFGTHFIGTTDAVEMSLRTNDKVRLVTNQDNTYSIGSFTSRPAYGFVGISPTSYFWDNGPGPFSRLHLAEPGANGFQGIGYRPWMRNEHHPHAHHQSLQADVGALLHAVKMARSGQPGHPLVFKTCIARGPSSFEGLRESGPSAYVRRSACRASGNSHPPSMVQRA